ncbi:hypothetical protein POM88_048480 [Heracleum sosnowskyi]|uniref:hAT-like transposase RNase-H fold domain-containing protein n=1 Tax=Heracleum sosnowskyi TaxID=360622 RepID=A0AAD8GVE6_9APIA|nr:hypothetical protein POM88_048480 [Heracleum sosnowskyi]
MCLTAHYIDSDWKLEKQIINFCQISNHKGDTIDVAMKFEKAFTRYEEEDDKFVSYFMEKENGKKRMGPPTATDWHAASIFVKFLATFYEVTLKFSSTLHVTSNNFYHEICEVHSLLTDLAASRGPLLSSMAGSMKEKYDKYWGDAEDINPLLFLAVVLDPRYKMGYLKYCFESVYDAESVARIVTKVESLLQRMYAAYDGQGSDGDGSNSKVYQSNMSLNVGDGINKRKLLESYLHQQKMENIEKKNDLDRGQQGGLKLENYVDETHSYQFLEEENADNINDHETEKSKMMTKNIHIIDE